MNETCNICISSDRHGRGYVLFFDEPFGEQTPFELAGGFSVSFDDGFSDGGPIPPADLSLGLDTWLARHGWRRMDDVEASTSWGV